MVNKENFILDQLSYNIDNCVNTCSYIYIYILNKSFRSYSTSLSKVINSSSFMDMDIHVCLKNFHETITSLITKINLFMDFEFLISDIHSVSLYPSSIVSYLI